MKKIALLLAVLLMAVTANAKVEIGSLYYNLDDSTETAEVTYKDDYNNENYVSGDLKIPETVSYSGKTYSVTSIGNSAFWGCSGLTNVVIGISVTSIGNSAFYGCSGLTSVVIPNSVSSIGEVAFAECSGLTSVEIPNSVTSIGKSAFYYCSGLKAINVDSNNKSYASIDGVVFSKNLSTLLICPEGKKGAYTIPNSVTSIGEKAFYGCSGLTSVEIPNSVTSIGDQAFAYCSGLTSVEIPNSVTSIGNGTFSSCSGLTSVVIPNSVTSIGNGTFSSCGGLKSVIIPNSVTSIGESAFMECRGLTSVEIGNSVTSIEYDAFIYCSGLKAINVDSNNKSYTSIDGVVFSKDLKDLLIYPGGKEGAYTIPNSVTSIGRDAFIECIGLTSVVIPNSVTSIGPFAFSYCYGLTSVEIPNSVTSIGYSAFMDCSGLTKVNISDLAAWCKIDFGNTVSNPLFYAHNLFVNGEEVKNLVIPNSVNSIGNYAFYYCSGLTSVVIGISVTSIGRWVFDGCEGLKKSAYPSTISNPFPYGISIKYPAEDSVIENGFIYSKNKETLYFVPFIEGEFSIPNNVTSIGNRALEGCSGLTSVVIPNSATSIGEQAFSGCSGLTSVVIPNSVTTIGSDAFKGCEGLIKSAYPSTISNPFTYGVSIKYPAEDSVIENDCVFSKNKETLYFVPLYIEGEFIIPSSVTSIGEDAFNRCSGMTRVLIPNSVTTIGNSAFYRCSGLTTVEMPSSVTSIGEQAFENCIKLTDVGISNSVTTIGKSAFANCSALTSVDIPGSVTSIGSSAFENCSGLKNIVFFAKGLLELNNNAFSNCSNIESIYCNTARPPVGYDYNIFTSDTYSNAKLYVPTDQVNLYYSMVPWSKFFNIIATDDFPAQGTIGVSSVFADDRKVDVYNLNGTLVRRGADPSQLDDLAPGIYIIGGKKVVVK